MVLSNIDQINPIHTLERKKDSTTKYAMFAMHLQKSKIKG